MEIQREPTLARIVPSGKVYKQIFDAQVQLVKALESRQATVVELNEEKDNPQDKHIPLVKDGRQSLGTGILTKRQQTWVEGFPNEPHLENPVLEKFYNKQDHVKASEPESNVAAREVQGLPDVLTPAKKGSDIIERIAESRKLRHENCLEDMHQELGLISTNNEPIIVSHSTSLLEKLHANDDEIQTIMSNIEKDEDIFQYTLEELESLWTSVQNMSSLRQVWITDLCEQLEALEGERMDKVRIVFQENAETLRKIAHLMPPDLQRLLDKEAQLINQTVLSNRRSYSDLRCRLVMSDIERERLLHTQWNRRVQEWKQLHIEQAVQTFRNYMESKAVTEPSKIQEVSEEMALKQKEQNEIRIKLVESLKELVPPASTKTAVYKWNQEITRISKQIDEVNQVFFTKMYAEYEKVCQECLDQSERLKIDLIERRVCSEEEAQDFLKDNCLPLIGNKQKKFEKLLEAMDRQLEQHNVLVLTQLKSLFKFAQGACHVWDIHEIGLARQERALQEKLDDCRHKHDGENQEREANLDLVMDRMRQDATEQALKENLKKSLECLIKIKESYDSFHHQQCHIVNGYPSMVHDELERYDRALCKFFSVDRQHPEFASESPRKDLVEVESVKSDKKPRRRKKPAPGSAGSRSSSRASDDSEGSQIQQPVNPSLPRAVSEVLRTSKGTAFYVLAVAGEHGISEAGTSVAPPPSKTTDAQHKGDKQPAPIQESGNVVKEEEAVTQEDEILDTVDIEDGAASAAFLTESSFHGDLELNSSTEMPSYIIHVQVQEDILLDVKKTIRMNFLEHVDEWIDEALKRSRTVVAAKLEEMSSELDLRMHLHEPRAHRTELDVHNVRAAELVMHNERVSRHCKGITQALTNLKTEFTSLREEHDEWSQKYRNDIESLEDVFTNATKSSKLVALSNQLQIEQDSYMHRIRVSLREFRQKLDNTLQMLRGSNARFINSFKLFSDGGNFCPEEIEEYKTRLSKMSQKIDAAEGFVMADLEGMEARRLDQASKVSAEFEDRFKHHMIDLLFMEKIARWLTNTQVKIKSEVADSNTQALQLTQALDGLHRRVDACDKPNLDKESVSPAQLKDSLPVMFDSFYQRSVYLNCLKDSTPRPSSGATLQGNPALGARVVFSSNDTIPAISRPGKQPSEDPSVSVIKNILKTQKNRLLGETIEETPRQPPTMPQHQLAALPVLNERLRPSRPPTDSDKSRRSSRQGGPALSNAGTNDGQPKRITSGNQGHRNSVDNISMRSASNTSLFQPKRKIKGSRIDRRLLVFGETELPGEQIHFLGRIQRLLREALDGLLAASDMFYRQKGNRAVTRPQALQENFDSCAEVIVQKLQSYYTQADEYHNHCLQEFRSQLLRLEDEVCQVPHQVIKEYLAQSKNLCINERRQMDHEFSKVLETLEKRKVENNTILRPALGHPNQTEMLSELCSKEEERRSTYISSSNAHSTKLQENSANRAAEFTQNLARIAEQLLLQFDNMLTVDDVNKGRVPVVKHATSELVRRKNAGKPLEDIEEKTVRPRDRKTWPGVPKTELVLPSDEPKREIDRVRLIKEKGHIEPMTASITTSKTTLGHDATIEARDAAYQEYKKYFEGNLANINEVCADQMTAIDRWTESWKTNIEKVKQLY